VFTPTEGLGGAALVGGVLHFCSTCKAGNPIIMVFYQLVYLYLYPVVTVYRNGINGIPLFTARIQNPNQNEIQTVSNGILRYKLFIPLWYELKPLRIAL
jgi:hypothetical protein